jgi:hypothetical protein
MKRHIKATLTAAAIIPALAACGSSTATTPTAETSTGKLLDVAWSTMTTSAQQQFCSNARAYPTYVVPAVLNIAQQAIAASGLHLTATTADASSFVARVC